MVVSQGGRSVDFFQRCLKEAQVNNIAAVPACRDARILMLEREFDLVVINAPLKDETGERLARHITAKGVSQVILVVPAELFDAVSAHGEDDGVLTISKPVSKTNLRAAIKMARATQIKLMRLHSGSENLRDKMNGIRVVDRAKRALIEYMDMSENEAHRYIEKKAMDTRISKRAVAEEILKNMTE